VDNARVGPELERVWWQPGNSRRFAEFIVALTGKALTAEHLAARVNQSVEQRKADAKRDISRLKDVPERSGSVDLVAKIRVMHGHERVAELTGDFDAFCRQFADWIDAKVATA
jgi:hypothetical protein